MSVDSTVTCDGCGQVIDTLTGFCSEAYLRLENIWKGPKGDVVMDMSITPAIDGSKDFHGLDCLKVYLAGPGERHEQGVGTVSDSHPHECPGGPNGYADSVTWVDESGDHPDPPDAKDGDRWLRPGCTYTRCGGDWIPARH